MGVLDRTGRITVTDSVNLADALCWREGRLDFAERPLAEIIPQLERWYDLEVAIDDSSLASVPVTASFDGQTVDQALATLAETLDAGYTRAGRLVRLTANVRRR
jgi:transmembrane sensor